MGGIREGPLLTDEYEDEEYECPYKGTEWCDLCKYFMETCWGGIFDEDEEEEEE